MYADVKKSAIIEAEAVNVVGVEAVARVLAENCDFTGRVIDEVYGVEEMSASILTEDRDGNECQLVVLYLVDADDLAACYGDLSTLDYSNYTFDII